MENLPYLGFGIGLRPCHYEAIIKTRPSIDWFEIVSEDFLIDGGSPLHYLEQIRQQYPLVMHGVSLSIGSTDPLNIEYLHRLKRLIDVIEPCWVSDHLCWTGVDSINTHALLPLPFTEEAVTHVTNRTIEVQEFLGRQILLENISSYIDYSKSEMTEWEFISTIAKRSDCLILFDINNAYVNAFNHGFSALDFITGIPAERVQQFHISGHEHCGTHIIDTHDNDIIDDVWSLYQEACQRFSKASTLIERDDNIPDLNGMLVELNKAKAIYHKAVGIEEVL